MLLLELPYISDLLIETARDNHFPIIRTQAAVDRGIRENLMIDELHAIREFENRPLPLIYTNSENSLAWIYKHLNFTHLPEKISLFKDKARFRDLVKPLYPEFYYRELNLDEFSLINAPELPFPVIIKPAAGFFSLGVYRLNDENDWNRITPIIKKATSNLSQFYPVEVLDTNRFIIEQIVDGEEFAIDAYYDAYGQPVILNILKHLFASGEDVSDRVYISSREIIEENLENFERFLKDIGQLSQLSDFPLHAEVRIDKRGKIVPIEINPLRFGGWCTTADLAWFAYGFNPYVYYFSRQVPDWTKILEGKDGKLYSLIVLNNSTGSNGTDIARFDYDRLQTGLENPLELRRIDHKKHPVFGFIFAESRTENISELEALLKSDLREFIVLH